MKADVDWVNVGVLVGNKTIRFFEMKELGNIKLKRDIVEPEFPVSNFFVDQVNDSGFYMVTRDYDHDE